MRTDREKGRYDEANSGAPQFCEGAYKHATYKTRHRWENNTRMDLN